MTARGDAIEAGARAEYERLLSGNTYMVPWADLTENSREHYRKRPARLYDAMAPLIERAALITAGQKLRDRAEKYAADHPGQHRAQLAYHRHLLIAARVVEPEMTDDEMRAGIADLLGGMAERREIGGAS